DEGVVKNKAVYVALAVDRAGKKDVLGLWIAQTEAATFWLRVMTELQSRGVEDILITLIDGLTGFPDAIHPVFPPPQIHPGVVPLGRQGFGYGPYGEGKRIAMEFRGIYRAPTEAAAAAALATFAQSAAGQRHPPIAALWQRHWEHVRPVFAYPPAIRR